MRVFYRGPQNFLRRSDLGQPRDILMKAKHFELRQLLCGAYCGGHEPV
jgi:hypothetical protein